MTEVERIFDWELWVWEDIGLWAKEFELLASLVKFLERLPATKHLPINPSKFAFEAGIFREENG